MKYSIILTAWKEPLTASRNVEHIINPVYSNLLPEMEVILVSPDAETYEAVLKVIKKFSFANFVYIKDEQKGKPFALNLALEHAQGEILVFTDGDVIIDKNALEPLVSVFANNTVGGVSGRPVSEDSKETIMGYWGHLLADAAHHKRAAELKKGKPYFMSGYLYAVRKISGLRFPIDSLVDDGWITAKMIDMGFVISYCPESRVFVKYPRSFSDWIRQKRRSMGGYSQVQVKQRSSVSSRSFVNELRYIFFPFSYASNVKEFFFSVLLFPARLWLWGVIWYIRKFKMKEASRIWQRVETTK